MQAVPLQPKPNQTVTFTIAGQLVGLNLYTLSDGNLYMDVSVAGTDIITGVICENLKRIVRDAYLGFIGDLVFMDTQGSNDPLYSGLGSRYQLNYLSIADLAMI